MSRLLNLRCNNLNHLAKYLFVRLKPLSFTSHKKFWYKLYKSICVAGGIKYSGRGGIRRSQHPSSPVTQYTQYTSQDKSPWCWNTSVILCLSTHVSNHISDHILDHISSQMSPRIGPAPLSSSVDQLIYQITHISDSFFTFYVTWRYMVVGYEEGVASLISCHSIHQIHQPG